MTRTTFFLTLFLGAVAGVAAGADKPAAKPSVPATTAKGTNTQVIAYYFHGTVRCETCLKIEKQAREAIERRFPAELTAKRLMFKPLNYDLPENAHFLQDYKLPCPSLVLVRQKDGEDEKWKLLGETWQQVGGEAKFNCYVTDAVSELLPTAK